MCVYDEGFGNGADEKEVQTEGEMLVVAAESSAAPHGDLEAVPDGWSAGMCALGYIRFLSKNNSTKSLYKPE